MQVFGLALVNLLLLPQKHGKIIFSTINMVQSLFLGINEMTPTLIPVIIADIFTAVTGCQKKKDKLKKELEDYQLQLIVADHVLEDAQSQLKRETKKIEKLERALDAFDKIQEGIRKFSIGSSRKSQRTSLARHEDFVKMISRTTNEKFKKEFENLVYRVLGSLNVLV